MKRKLLSSLVASALTVGCLTVNAQDLNRESLSFTAEQEPEFQLPVGQTPQFIVKFKDVKSLDGELKDIRYTLKSAGLGELELAEMLAEERQLLERELLERSEQRVHNLNTQIGVNVMRDRQLATGADLISVDLKSTRMSLADIKQDLESLPNVEYVEFNRMLRPMFTPNDTHYGVQWHYFEATAGLRANTAWDTATGTGAVVAVLDTGYRPHVDLDSNIIGGYDFVSNASNARDGNGRDSNAEDEGDWVASANECYAGSPASNSSWHGTHVAGTIAAETNNNQGVAGVAYNAKIVPVRVLAKCGGTIADIADAIIWSSGGSVSGVPGNPNPADVINMSLGGGGSCDSTSQSAINTAVNNGTVVVVAAGNENQNASNSNPANCSNVVTVAANDRQGNRASYSNYGSVVDVTAPGGETATSGNGVASTLNAGTTTPGADNYVYFQGTSMATPHVAGVAALMKGLDSSLTPAQIESMLKSTARPLAGSCSGGCGAGLVDATAAVAAVSGGGGGGGGGGGSDLSNGDSVSGISGSSGSWQYWTIDVPSGASNLVVAMSGGSGDADLYVRAGAQPTTSSYDCRPYVGGNTETCSFASPAATTYHIGIRAYSTYSNTSFSVNYDEPGGGGGGASGGGSTVTGISASRRQWARYTIEVPAGMASLDIDISGGNGDADLYVRYGSQSSTGSYDCRPYLSGNNESCSFSNPAAGTWHIDIRAYSAFSGVTLDAYYNP